MSLHVIFRSCSLNSVHFKERFIPVPKTELIFQCLRSLIVSLHNIQNAGHLSPACAVPAHAGGTAQAGRMADITLTVIDDHSSPECVSGIKDILAQCPWQTEFVPLAESGNNASMKFCYALARDSKSELLYLVEDDYLHTLGCVPEMIETHAYFKEKLTARKPNPEVALMPVDNLFHYFDETMFSSPLVLGPARHWRVNYYSNWSMLIPQESIVKHWSAWDAFSKYRLDKPETHEDALLVPLFKEHIYLFTPVPTLALHVAGERYQSPFSDWKKIWHDVENAWNTLTR